MTQPSDSEDSQWLDALAGKPDPTASPGINHQAAALRKALQERSRAMEQRVPQADSAQYEQILLRLKREGLISPTDRGPSGVIQGGQIKEASLISRALALAMAVLSSGSVRQPWREAPMFSRGASVELTPEMWEADLRSNLERAERSQGLDHPDVADLLMDLANWYEQQGRHAVAEPLYKRSSAIYEKVVSAGIDDRIDQDCVVDGLRHLALYYENQSRYAEAESQYNRLLSILENYYHSDEQVAEVLNNIAVLYQKQGRHAEAESLLKLSVEITEKAHNVRRSIQSAPEPRPEPLPGPFDWIKRIFTGSDSNWWKPAAAFAALLIVPLLFILMRQDSPQTPQIATSPGAQNRYIAGGDIQELRVVQPELKARELENRLRALRALPEIRYETGGTISVEADLKAVAEIDRYKLFADFGLKPPAAGMLRVLFVAAPAVPDPDSPGKIKP